jgi:hypothetical protein
VRFREDKRATQKLVEEAAARVRNADCSQSDDQATKRMLEGIIP